MKIGLSTYSLQRAVHAGKIDLPGIVDWVADNGGEQLELALAHYVDKLDDTLINAIKNRAAARGIVLSSYTIRANFFVETREEWRTELARVKLAVETAAKFGVTIMRHDAGRCSLAESTPDNFERALPMVAEACGLVADYAVKYGITTTVENHGFLFQNSERVRRLVKMVNRPNYRTTLDIGNFLCADEEPIIATKNNIDLAVMIHFKDFLRRSPGHFVPGGDWIETRGGFRLRGTIVGHGDINLEAVASVIRASGYDGFVSIEFEGPEDCFEGARIGMETASRLLRP